MTANEIPQLSVAGTIREGMLYVERPADAELFAALRRGELCYVLAPRQIGKSSLRVHTVNALRAVGVACASVDLTTKGSSTVTADQWYFGLVKTIAQELGLPGPQDYWRLHDNESAVERFSGWIIDVVLHVIETPVVVFIDEIDAVRALPFPRDDFFAAIRALFNGRAEAAELRRLTFCLLGVATPDDLMADPARTPFNVGRAIRLEDLTADEVLGFLPALARLGDSRRVVLRETYRWTNGHPYMTQRIFAEVMARDTGPRSLGSEDVSSVVESLFLQRGRVEDPNLGVAANYFRRSNRSSRISLMLRLYRRLLESDRIAADGADPVQQELRVAGMTTERRDDTGVALAIRNRIFAAVFDRSWLREREAEHLLAEPLTLWLGADRHDDFLLRGDALEAARQWLVDRSDVTPEEKEFVDAGSSLEREQRASRERDREQRQRAEQTAARRSRLALVFVALSLALMGALAVAGHQYRRARSSAVLAQQLAERERRAKEQAIVAQDEARAAASKEQRAADAARAAEQRSSAALADLRESRATIADLGAQMDRVQTKGSLSRVSLERQLSAATMLLADARDHQRNTEKQLEACRNLFPLTFASDMSARSAPKDVKSRQYLSAAEAQCRTDWGVWENGVCECRDTWKTFLAWQHADPMVGRARRGKRERPRCIPEDFSPEGPQR